MKAARSKATFFKASMFRKIINLVLSFILVSSLFLTSAAPITHADNGTIATGTGPYGITYHNGYIYTAHRNSDSITRTSLADQTVETVVTNVSSVMTVALNSGGDLFYTRDSGRTIQKIPAASLNSLPVNGASSQAFASVVDDSVFLYGMTFDENDNLYLSNFNMGLLKIAKGSTTPVKLGGSISKVYGMTFSPIGDMYFTKDDRKLYKISQNELESSNEPVAQLVDGATFSDRTYGIAALPDGNIVFSRLSNSTIEYLGYEIPPTPPGIELVGDPVISIDPAHVNDTVSVVSSVYTIGSKPIISRGVEYRPYSETAEEAWIQVPNTTGDLQAKESFTSVLTGLQWQKKYEVRGYVNSDAESVFTEIKSFVLEDDPTIGEPDVRFDRVGPSVVHVKDKKRIVTVGEGMMNLFRKPLSEINYYLDNGTTQVPLSYNVKNNNQLELTWTADLEPGPYEVHLEHQTFTDFVLADDPLTEELEGLTIVLTDFYKPRSFEKIDVPSTSSENMLESLSIQGPFTERPSAPGVYTLDDTSEAVVINGNLLFKGSSLVVDKSSGDGKTVINGNGRLYLNGSVQDATMSYTLLDGPFTFSSDQFSLALTGGAPADYLKLNLPIQATSMKLAQGGLVLAGNMELGFTAGSQKVSGTIPIDSLSYRNNRFDLVGTYTLNKTFKLGPIDASNTKFVIDSRYNYVSVNGKGLLPGTNVSFDLYMDLKQGRLDAIDFGVYNKVDFASTGLKINYLYGDADNLAGKTQIPQRLSAYGSVTDILVPQLKHPQATHKFNLLGTDRINVDLTPYGFDASGIEYYYWLAVNQMNMQAVVNPSLAAIKGFSQQGFRVSGDINAYQVIKGTIGAVSFNKKDYSGVVKATVYVPKGIPRIGGATVRDVVLSVNEKQIIGMLQHNGIKARVSYTFSNNTILFEVEAEPPKKSWWEKGLEFFKGINDFFDKIEPLGSLLEEIFLSYGLKELPISVASVDGELRITGIKSSMALSAVAANGKMQRIYEMTPIGLVAQPEIASNSDSTAKIVDGQLTAVDRSLAISAEPAGSSGQSIFSFKTDTAFDALLVLSGDQRNAVLKFASADKPNDEKTESVNAVYLSDENKTFIRVKLGAGSWKLEAQSDSKISINEILFGNPSLEAGQLAQTWASAPERPVAAFVVRESGSYALTVEAGEGDAIIYKPDGRPYYLQSEPSQPNWNAFRTFDGRQHALLSAAGAGTWLIVAEESPAIEVGIVEPKTNMNDLKQWVQGNTYPTVFNVERTVNGQAIVEIYGADEDTLLYMPNGQPYALQPDATKDGMNVIYDQSQKKMTVWLDGLEKAGQWKAAGNGFVSVVVNQLNRKFKSIKPLLDEGRYSQAVFVTENGDYMLSISGGDRDTVVLDPNGKAYTLDFTAPDGNAYLQPAADRLPEQTAGGDPVNETEIDTPNPAHDGKDMLYVTLQNATAGKWLVQNKTRVGLEIQKLIPTPSVSATASVDAGANNRVRVVWSTDNAAGDTAVTVMLTDSKDAYIGDVVAAELPASGNKVITIPAGVIPGTYYVTVMATSQNEVPVYAVAEGTIEVTAPYNLEAPVKPTVLSTGNEEITLQFPSVSGQVERYRVWIGEGANGEAVTPYVDIEPQQGNVQEVTISGLAVNADYVAAVSAIGQQDGRLVISPLSESVSLTLPAANPAALGVSADAGAESVASRPFTAYDGSHETLLITRAGQVKLEVTSDQAATLDLIVDGQRLDSVQAAANSSHIFDLNELLSVNELDEREYKLAIETVNERGDRGLESRRLVIDRTLPLLIASGGDDANGAPIPLNGTVDSTGKIRIMGQTEIGAKLDINGVILPLDDQGRFAYYAPLAWESNQDLKQVVIQASDAAGNTTAYSFQVIKDSSGNLTAYPTDLAALTTTGAVLNQSYQFGVAAYQAVASSDKIRIHAVPMVDSSAVTIDGQQLTEGGYVEVAVPNSTRSVQIRVQSAGNEPANSYSLEIVNGSNVALISDLTLKNKDGETIAAPAFTGVEESYEVYVGNDTDEVTLTLSAVMAGSVVTVNGQNVQSGQASLPIALQADNNSIPVTVVSPDQSVTKTYDVVVWREPSGDADLRQLGITTPGAVLQSGFSSDVTEYKVSVPEGTSAFSLQPIAEQADAVITVNGQAVSGSPVQLGMSGDSLRVAVEVKAQDDTTRQYTLNVLRQKAAPAAPPLLSELKADVSLDRTFAPYIYNYGLTSTWDSGILNVTAVSSDPQAIVTVMDKSLQGGGKFTPALEVGVNKVLITVESADLTASQSYWIEVTRVQNSSSKGEVRQTTITGNAGEWSHSIPIVRTVGTGGVLIDTLSLDASTARTILSKAEQNKVKTVRIHVTDLPQDPADERMVNLSSVALSLLAEAGLSLQITTPETVIDLQNATLKELGARVQDAYFRVVPVVSDNERTEVASRVLNAELVKQVAEDGKAKLLGSPVQIETNYSGYKTELLFPLTGLTWTAASNPSSKLAVYIEHSDGEKVLAKGDVRYDSNGKVSGLAVNVNKFSTFTVVQLSGEQDAATLAPYLTGYPDGTFRPSKTIKRAEFAAILHRLGLGADGQAAGFGDVADQYWAAEAIASVRNSGLMLGDNKGLFRPEANVTRAEMASIVARLLPETAATAEKRNVPGDAQGHWASEAIGKTMQAGILAGYPDGTFRPEQALTRAEAVRVLNLLLKRPTAEVAVSSWPDVPTSHWAIRDIESASGTVTVQEDGSVSVKAQK
ncbi:cadherin-like beta sandwich domain-containing protein [Paenibacillus sp. CAU 1782]